MKFDQLIAVSCLLFPLLSYGVSESKKVNAYSPGVKIGDVAPELTAVTDESKKIQLADLYGEKGLVLLFFRSADWCRYCKGQLLTLKDEYESFVKLGYKVAALSYDKPEILKSFKTKHNISYQLLSDIAAKTVLDYGVLNKKYKKDHDAYGIPEPGIFVIKKSGTISHKYFIEGYKDRTEFFTILSDLSK